MTLAADRRRTGCRNWVNVGGNPRNHLHAPGKPQPKTDFGDLGGSQAKAILLKEHQGDARYGARPVAEIREQDRKIAELKLTKESLYEREFHTNSFDNCTRLTQQAERDKVPPQEFVNPDFY